MGYIFSPSAYSNAKRKKVKPEGNDYLQKTYHNWTKANELQRLCFKQDTKANQRCLKAMWALRTCCCFGKNNKSMVTIVSQLLTKTKTFKLNQSLTCADFGIDVATCVMCKVARRPWAPRIVLEFAIKTDYVLDSWRTTCCPWISSGVLENSCIVFKLFIF